MLFFLSLAQATTYVYDGDGRLVAVTNNDGTSGQYTYDALGNIVRISAVPAGQLKLFAFTPTHGAAGTSVTLYGQGFSSTAVENTVTFGGVATAVHSATANQLVVNVPDGAATGLIGVAANGQSTSSDVPFVVDDTGLPPTITQISPNIAAVGDVVTVSGAYLYPRPGDTSVRLGGRSAEIQNPTNNQLSISIPSTVSSGHITVQTPYGFAKSVDTVLVPPTGVTGTSIVSRGVATIDIAPVSLSIPQGGQIGAVLFDSRDSQWLSLQASAITTSANNITYKVYAPGNVLVQQGTVSASIPSVHLPQLHVSGTYLVTFQPDTAGAQLTVAVESNPTLTSGVLATSTTDAVGQSKRMIFGAQAGQTLAFQVVAMATTPAGIPATFTIYKPDGTAYTSGTTASVGLINLPNLPVAGTYQVIAAPNGATAASMRVGIIPGTTGSLSPGTSQTYTANAPGQNVYLNFTAKTGDNLELVLSQMSVAGATDNGFPVNVYNQVGAQVASTWCYPTNPGASCNLHLWYLAAGTYSVIATPYYGGTLHFDALIQPNVVGPSVALNSTTSLSLGMGQVERFSFNANAGDTVALQVSGVTTTPAGQPIQFLVYRPDAGAITVNTPAYSNFSPGDGQLVNLPNLPVSGTYTVIAIPAYGLPGSAQFSLVAGVTGDVPPDGTVQTYNGNAPSQNVYLNFTAKTGDNLELVLSQMSVAGATDNGFPVNVYNQVGAQVASTWCYPTNPGASCNLHLWYLAAGTYSVIVTPIYGGTLHFDALIQPNVVGPSVALNSTTSLSLGMGQVERFSFNANAGDTVALQVSGVTTTPAGQPIQFLVYRPDAGAITVNTPAYSNFSPGDGQLVNLPNLPVSGTYTVIAIPAYGLPGSALFTLASQSAGTPPTTGTGSLPSTGVPQSYSAAAAGQNVTLSFDANLGDNLELTFNNISVPESSNGGFQVDVYSANGTNISEFYCYSSNPGASCRADLWNLTAGTYSVVASPIWGGQISFNALLTKNTIEPKLVLNAPTDISVAAGQIKRLTFDANLGDTLALQLSGVTTTPAGRNVTVKIYRPDVGAITPGNYYTYIASGDTSTLNLSNLPVGGTYTVTVEADYGLPANAQLTVFPGATDEVLTDGTVLSKQANVVGQNVYLSFDANLGDNLELTFNNISVPESSNDGFQVDVYSANGTNISEFYCYSSNPGASCRADLWNLTAGTYSVVATPIWGGQISFNALLTKNVMAPPVVPDALVDMSLEAGQVKRSTFTAEEGGAAVLQLSGVSTAPIGRNVTVKVYRPDVGAITPGNYYTYFASGSTSVVNLTNLPIGGTYTVTIEADYGVPANAQLGFSKTIGTIFNAQ